jgi:hypothetical protein
MLRRPLLIALPGCIFLLASCAPARQPPAPQAPPPVPAHAAAAPAPAAPKMDFATQIRPVLEARCQPCHFTGGSMYEKLPFDRPETIRHLGEKLFTRIQAQEEQALLRAFLAEAP